MPQNRIGNWGKWGPNDERGTLNYITPEKVLKAARLVKKGRVYSLAVPLEKEGPIWPSRNKTIHLTSYTNDFNQGGRGSADDMVIMHTHGTTHVDSLAHVWVDGLLYNGHPAQSISSRGAEKNSIDKMGALVTRGVLLDLAAYKGVDYLEKGYVVTPRDLEGCARAEGVSIESGDALLLRTGWIKMFSLNRQEFDYFEPGIGLAAARWFGEKEICAVAADNHGVEVMPWEGDERLPVHMEIIRNQGGYMLELFNLEELAQDKVHECLLVVAPLRITAGIGSPLNPIAIA